MWFFLVKYINIITGKVRTEEIAFDGKYFFNTDEECYMYAMKIALERRNIDEHLLSIEFDMKVEQGA